MRGVVGEGRVALTTVRVRMGSGRCGSVDERRGVVRSPGTIRGAASLVLAETVEAGWRTTWSSAYLLWRTVSRWSERRRVIWGGDEFWRVGTAAEKGRRWDA